MGPYDPTYGATKSVDMTASAFAGTVLITVAVFQVLQGIAAVAADDVYVTGIEYVYQLDVTSWGWIHIVVGVLALVAGAGVLARQTWAYVTGIILAVVASLANFAFLPYYPIWSLVILAFNIAVIWALSSLLARGGTY
ncbi:hypothetical protein [Promicromonospora sp. AC04]|uniref:DUF7144 family membrane protein n=1 Tax=Promicromonospora sp. AC04 TaxID=2135723 RepID=UPI000D33882C|nr:hypothetical protein [Promicromonospora sp. AC04]